MASADNPADCLTKSGLDDSHLESACDISSFNNWVDLFGEIEKLVAGDLAPRWQDVAALSRFAVHV